ncbi:MAG TPA: hypothetical protein PLM53_15630 [Spirochaetota bacterium]|nr:hypothetical protein [Spirochaetota bacterium]HPC39831.1 hypothetical protein [Spirochaetota bacterium]HPL16303.1 hypothetical protein [Spirochaetota bacterium]HQF09878.1 hypothetical protein [Spirochaetota bacterium]HQH98528.1 hypothetical protein [Spirochaetota bacterium]
MSIEQLITVFEAKRDPYMEWHDGPSLPEVDAAMADLDPEERAAASRIVAERIRKGYDPYLGRAAELLGTEECRKALDEVLAKRPGPYGTGTIARNILTMGKSDDAVAALRAIVENRSLGWGERIDALVNLKIAIDASGSARPITDFITPEFETVIFDAVTDNDYLVRYHAAEALLKAAGDRTDLSDHRDLFGYICGKHATDGTPDSADREGFRRAVEIIRRMMKK